MISKQEYGELLRQQVKVQTLRSKKEKKQRKPEKGNLHPNNSTHPTLSHLKLTNISLPELPPSNLNSSWTLDNFRKNSSPKKWNR